MPDVRMRARALVRERGATAAARELRVPRETLLGVAADAHVHEATLELVAARLAEHEAGRP